MNFVAMKDLYLIRHAKSDWENISQTDFDRPLNKRGLKNAPFMAEILSKKLKSIDEIISSPAKRAISTAVFFAEEFNVDKKKIAQDERIYEAPVSSLLEVINQIDDANKTVLMFGHNPGLPYLINYLTGESCEMPTCAVAHIRFNADSWKMVSADMGKLIDFDFPKKHL